MTELILYRLNRVPEKNYLAFLNMIGIRLRSPQPARALMTFDLVEGAEKQVIKEGTQIATAQAADEDTIIFETQKELVVVGAPLDRCFSYFNETLRRQLAVLRTARSPKGFEAFAGADRIDRFFYLGDQRLKAVSRLVGAQAHHLGARSRRPRSGAPARVGILERPALARAAHDAGRGRARRGRVLRPAGSVVDAGARRRRLLGARPPGRGAAEPVGDRDRHRQGGHRDRRRRRRSRHRVRQPRRRRVPRRSISARTSSRIGQQPKIDQCLYLASREMLSQPEAEVRIEIVLSDATVAPAPVASDDLIAVVGVLRRQEVAHPRQVGPQGHRPLAGEPVGLHRRHQRLHQDRRRHLPRADGHAAPARSTARTTTGYARASSSATTACPAATCSTGTSGCGATIARSSRRRSSRSVSSTAPICST